jgi:hypothetical protein
LSGALTARRLFRFAVLQISPVIFAGEYGDDGIFPMLYPFELRGETAAGLESASEWNFKNLPGTGGYEK